MNATPLHIAIDDSVALAMLQHLRGAAAATAGLHRAAARAIANTVKRHVVTRKASGGRWWGLQSEIVTSEGDAVSGRVSISRPYAWHWRGGTIRPKDGKRALAIPMRRSGLKGIWPSEFDPARSKTFVWRSKSGKAYIAGQGPDQKLRLLYRLVPSVTKGPDPSVMPSTSEATAAANAAIHTILKRAIRPGGPRPPGAIRPSRSHSIQGGARPHD